ncbi:MAG TPA: hypothetical protein VIH15_07915, partial [Casimicrobiaceae bacterium]
MEDIDSEAKRFGLDVVRHPPSCTCALHFQYGLKVRPFFAKLVEPIEKRAAAMDAQGVDHQVLSTWTDIFAHGLPKAQACDWHRY